MDIKIFDHQNHTFYKRNEFLWSGDKLHQIQLKEEHLPARMLIEVSSVSVLIRKMTATITFEKVKEDESNNSSSFDKFSSISTCPEPSPKVIHYSASAPNTPQNSLHKYDLKHEHVSNRSEEEEGSEMESDPLEQEWLEEDRTLWK